MLILGKDGNATFTGLVGIGAANPGDRQLYVEGTTSTIEIESTSDNQNASVWFRSNSGGTSADRWEIGTNIALNTSFELYNRAISNTAWNVDASNNTTLGRTQGTTVSVGISTASTTSKQGRLILKGKNNYSDGSTWYGDHGEIEFASSTNMTASSRSYLFTNAYLNNHFAIIQSTAAATAPVTNSTSAGIDSGAYVMKIDGSRNVTFDSPTLSCTTAMSVGGALSKGSGSFKIDHPLESKKDTHHLVHSFIEGPKADLIYRGKVTLKDGTATVNIDTVSNMTEGTFVALNTDVQCFTTNESNWDLVKGSVSGNILTITSNNSSSTATISWMVIGERHDDNIKSSTLTDNDGKIIVEVEKTETDEEKRVREIEEKQNKD
jgi:hypothetical protein